MNLTALTASVGAKGYAYVQAADDPTNPILLALNSTYRQVCGSQRWPFLAKTVTLATTTTGQQTYVLSGVADYFLMDAVRLTDGSGNRFDLEHLDAEDFKAQTWESTGPADNQNGTPVAWTEYAGGVQLYPIPDGAYTITIDYFYQPADLAAVSDVPVLPAAYHDVLVWGAVYELAYRERDWIGRGSAFNTFESRAKEMEEEYCLRQRQSSSRVQRSGFNDTPNEYAYLPGLGS